MTLMVEDGSMPDGANAFCGVNFADAWLAARGHDDWPPEPTEDVVTAAKEAALVTATDYLNGLRWYGLKAMADQPRTMAWPRVGAYDSDGYEIGQNVVPPAVKAANSFLARLVFTGTDLQPILERGGRVQSEKVGSLSTSYFEDSASRDVYTGLADLLRGLASDFEDYAGTGTAKRGFSIHDVTT